ncbi:MAG: ABC transporter permease [Elusimicrobiota bacterium]
MIKEIFYLIKKNILIEKNYKFTLISNLFSLSLTLLIFYFINSYFKYEVERYLKSFDINYFSYVFVSFLVFNYSGGNSTINQRINFDISSGVFEFIISNKSIIISYLISLIIYSFLLSSIEAVLYYLIVCQFDLIKISSVNIMALITTLIISVLIFSSIAFLSSSFVVLFKKGDIISFFIAIFESIFGGVYFPTQLLPEKIRIISDFIPLNYSIKAFQKIFYSQANLVDISAEIKILIAFLIFLFPISLYLFSKSIEISKRMGNLNQY